MCHAEIFFGLIQNIFFFIHEHTPSYCFLLLCMTLSSGPLSIHLFFFSTRYVADTGNHNGNFDKAVTSAKAADYMLVNLEDDLSETTDLKAKHPKIYDDLKKRFVSWLEKGQPQSN